MNSGEIDGFERCLGTLYAAVSGPESWEAAAERVRQFIGTDFININYLHVQRLIAATHCTGPTDSQKADYYANWAHRDVMAERELQRAAFHVGRVERMFPVTGIRSLEVFEGFYEPVGMVYQAGGHVPIGNGWFGLLSMQNGWSAGRISDRQLARLQGLLPHLQCALGIAERLRTLSARATAAERLVQHGDGAVFICDAGGTVLDLNQDAQAALRRFAALLRIRTGRLALAESGANRRLQELLASPRHSAGQAAPVLFVQGASGEALECTVLELKERAPKTAAADALRLVIVRRLGEPGPVDPHYLRHRFGLTPTEAAVLARLMTGEDLPGIAAARGSTLQTIRSYVKTLRRKLHCHSQAQLVSLGWRGIAVPGPLRE